MNVAEYIADTLYSRGVRRVFGLPGGASIPYMEEFRKKGIEFILVSNEASAAIMADVSARITGITGVCHATLGPGATNITTGVGEALLDRSPVIVFTSEVSEPWLRRTTQMNISHQDLFKPLTKATFRLSPTTAMETMDAAFNIATSEYPGPVHIGLPADIYNLEISEKQAESDGTGLQANDNDDSEGIDEALKLIKGSGRPLLAVGLTSERLGLSLLLQKFLKKYPVPVLVTPMARSVLPSSDPHFAGVLFHAGSNHAEALATEADLIIGFGYDTVEYNYESWTNAAPLIHFDTLHSGIQFSGEYIHITSGADTWFRLLETLNPTTFTWPADVAENTRAKIMSDFSILTDHFGAAAAVEIIGEELPGSAMVTADVGSHLHVAGQYLKLSCNNRLIMTNGWSGMGFGIPAALAVQFCRPEIPVLCITGDGGFLMMAGELITAKRYKLPVKIIVFSDGELNLIRIKQEWKNLPSYATSLYDKSLFEADTFLGIKILHANSHNSLRKALRQALELQEPVILDVSITPDDYKNLIVKR